MICADLTWGLRSVARAALACVFMLTQVFIKEASKERC